MVIDPKGAEYAGLQEQVKGPAIRGRAVEAAMALLRHAPLHAGPCAVGTACPNL
jgi:hypothetical protein